MGRKGRAGGPHHGIEDPSPHKMRYRRLGRAALFGWSIPDGSVGDSRYPVKNDRASTPEGRKTGREDESVDLLLARSGSRKILGSAQPYACIDEDLVAFIAVSKLLVLEYIVWKFLVLKWRLRRGLAGVYKNTLRTLCLGTYLSLRKP